MTLIRRIWRRRPEALVPAYANTLSRLTTRKHVRLSLALQGGGAHGAFAWGVLDALLEEPRITFEAISGSSAGAINAALLASGWLNAGREGARRALAVFWRAIGTGIRWPLLTVGTGENRRLSPAARLLVDWAGHFSPAELNPLDLNPLRDMLSQQVDFARLRAASPFKLFIAATHANSGRLRLFREQELRVEMLLASACLPKIQRAVEIAGEAYWDGGYSANPAVFPLIWDCAARDILLVLLTPLEWTSTPVSASQINERIVELAFSTHFRREMRAVAGAIDRAGTGIVAFGRLARRLRGVRFHLLDPPHTAAFERTDTKLLADAPFLEWLHDLGRARARAWLARNGGALGRRSTVDLHRWFT